MDQMYGNKKPVLRNRI